MELLARTFDVHDDDDVQQLYRERGWTDGLPVIAPTPARVETMLTHSAFAPDQVIGIEPVKQRALTAEKVAVNAVLAGCLPPDFPVVAAAVEAMCKPEFLVHGATASTGGCAVLLVVNGPIRHQLGMSSAHSVLAGADRASICIG
ncbi:MAG: hypothetical protein AB7W59_30615, partial [Acidimicrobiia bacterium]